MHGSRALLLAIVMQLLLVIWQALLLLLLSSRAALTRLCRLWGCVAASVDASYGFAMHRSSRLLAGFELGLGQLLNDLAGSQNARMQQHVS
jgi:hypothetical protein